MAATKLDWCGAGITFQGRDGEQYDGLIRAVEIRPRNDGSGQCYVHIEAICRVPAEQQFIEIQINREL